MTQYDIFFGRAFRKSVKKLAKRYPSVKKDVAIAIETLTANPLLGTRIPGGFDVRKLRIPNSDMKRGKKRQLSSALLC